MKIRIPEYVDKVMRRLNGAGFEAYIVGGCVRDILMGQPSSDFDVATSASPDEICRCFKGYKTIEVGKRYGTVIVVSEGAPVEVTAYRIDGEYRDGRHPEKVLFTPCLEKDLARRDFTMNAMAYNPLKGLRDPFGGAGAIKEKKIIAVGQPERRFEEDALRILRGLRFASVFGFSIEEKTAEAMDSCRCGIKKISAERISRELVKLIMGKNADRVLRRYEDILQTAAEGFQAAPVELLPVNAACRLAALFPVQTEECLKKLRFDNSTIGLAGKIARLKDMPLPEDEPGICEMLRSFGPQAVKLFFEAKGKGKTLERVLQKEPCYSLKHLAVKGNDLLEAGIPPGPAIGENLNMLLDRVIEHKAANRKEELLALLR